MALPKYSGLRKNKNSAPAVDQGFAFIHHGSNMITIAEELELQAVRREKDKGLLQNHKGTYQQCQSKKQQQRKNWPVILKFQWISNVKFG